jgi:hypothetical protein
MALRVGLALWLMFREALWLLVGQKPPALRLCLDYSTACSPTADGRPELIRTPRLASLDLVCFELRFSAAG